MMHMRKSVHCMDADTRCMPPPPVPPRPPRLPPARAPQAPQRGLPRPCSYFGNESDWSEWGSGPSVVYVNNYVLHTPSVAPVAPVALVAEV
ncbi:unnamed protein product [Heligmosomoides polygyrus]|uniref:Uncharacterized protein n=1 Tax=Heligmosomoides polygyrus TaxID=6339 RepID=A0A3P7Y6C3_HELPZ|nr:unnamed protein product [Heligmosomoides polygyrus]